MNATAEITKVVIAVEIDGAPYFINLPHDRMVILMKLASSLGDNGLPVVKAPAGYAFHAIGATA